MSLSNGAVLFINNQSNVMSFIQTGIDLVPGSLTNIGINKMHFSKLPQPYNECVDKSKKATSYTKFTAMIFKITGTYNLEQCMDLCIQTYLLDEKSNCLAKNLNQTDYLNDCFDLSVKETFLKK